MNQITAASTGTAAGNEQALPRPLVQIAPPGCAPVDLRTALIPADTRLTYTQVAELIGCDPNTVRNHHKKGMYAHPEKKGPGRSDPWLIPVTDLVTAGDLAPERIVEAAVYAEAHADAKRTEALRADLAAARAEIAVLRELVGNQSEDIAFLRQFLAGAHGQVAGDREQHGPLGSNREEVALWVAR